MILSLLLLFASCVPPVEFGKWVGQEQADKIMVRMTMTEVQTVLGDPQTRISKRNDKTTRWIQAHFHVDTTTSTSTQLVVDSGKDGKVSIQPV